MRTFSGIQPTGAVHLGNYLGAIQSWAKTVEATEQKDRLQNLFCIVDLHAITLKQEPEQLRRNIVEMSASLLACGLDPTKCVLFQQSAVTHHAELCWLLTCLSTLQGMQGMSTYKDKSANLNEVPLGLFMYPLLQAADILLYKGTHVPVGEDNLQNVELSRKVAKLFNNRFCVSKGEPALFPVPQAVLVESTARVKSLRHPEKKMSKSDRDGGKSCVYVHDTDDEIRKKVRKAVTDTRSEVTFDPEERPGVSNLVSIHAAASGKPVEVIVKEAEGLDTGKYKSVVADALCEKIGPIRRQITDYLNNKDHLEKVIEAGNESAREIAHETMAQAKKYVGLTS